MNTITITPELWSIAQTQCSDPVHNVERMACCAIGAAIMTQTHIKDVFVGRLRIATVRGADDEAIITRHKIHPEVEQMIIAFDSGEALSAPVTLEFYEVAGEQWIRIAAGG